MSGSRSRDSLRFDHTHIRIIPYYSTLIQTNVSLSELPHQNGLELSRFYNLCALLNNWEDEHRGDDINKQTNKIVAGHESLDC